MARRLRNQSTSPSFRLKDPVNPSVRGTGKQSLREKKGFKHPSLHHAEGAGHPPGYGGRGGKASRRTGE